MDKTTYKLILLYVFDQMNIPMTTETLNDMCCSQNAWLSYLTLTEAIPELVDARFLIPSTSNNTEYYKITQDGRDCLNYFYIRIPHSIRNQIGEYIKKNRQNYKRKQEYFKDYFKNRDGTYTVSLKIVDPDSSKFELKLNVPNREEAIKISEKWDEQASEVYSAIYKILIDGE